MQMYRFYNVNASTMRTIIVAHCKLTKNTDLKPCCDKSILIYPCDTDQQRKRKGSESTANKTMKKINSDKQLHVTCSNTNMDNSENVDILKCQTDSMEPNVLHLPIDYLENCSVHNIEETSSSSIDLDYPTHRVSYYEDGHGAVSNHVMVQKLLIFTTGKCSTELDSILFLLKNLTITDQILD